MHTHTSMAGMSYPSHWQDGMKDLIKQVHMHTLTDPRIQVLGHTHTDPGTHAYPDKPRYPYMYMPKQTHICPSHLDLFITPLSVCLRIFSVSLGLPHQSVSVLQLLCLDAAERLSSLDQLKKHEYMADVDFTNVLSRNTKPSFIPAVSVR